MAEEETRCPADIRPYFDFRDELVEENGVLFRSQRCVTPTTLRKEVVKIILSTQMAVASTIRYASDHVFWPGINAMIKDHVQKFETCQSAQPNQQKETLLTTEIPVLPWDNIGADLLHFAGDDLLITTDYYSNYWELDPLKNTLSKSVRSALKKTVCTAWNSSSFKNRQRSTVCVGRIQDLCQSVAIWAHYVQALVPWMERKSGKLGKDGKKTSCEKNTQERIHGKQYWRSETRRHKGTAQVLCKDWWIEEHTHCFHPIESC